MNQQRWQRQFTVNDFQFRLYDFDDLDTVELMQIYRLRQAVFVVEQNCPYNDIDDADLQALHLCHIAKDHVVGYARISVAQNKVHIGRVVIATAHRRTGLGRALMLAAIDQCRALFEQSDIIISAQSYLMKFYRDLGFVDCGDYYLEDNIPHMKMRYQAN